MNVKKKLFGAFALLALVAAPALAQAATQGFSTANVNMRSGPSTAYPAVVVIPNGAPLTIHGCLSDTPWCDVSFSYGRGWVAGRYVQAIYRQNRVYVEPRYYRDLGVPVITFEAGRYWDRYYRDRDFYRERDRWRRPAGGGYWNAPPPRGGYERPRPPRDEWRDQRGRDESRDPRGRGPNDGRWEERYGDWNQNDRPRPPRDNDRPRWDNDNRDRDRERPRWDNDNRDRDRNRGDMNRDRDMNRDQNRDANDQRRQDDEGSRRPGVNQAPRPPEGGQQFGCIVGSPGCQAPR